MAVGTVVQEITERKRLAEESRQYREKLAHVSRLSTMGEMATGLAHELNQPLSGIATFAAACIMRLRTSQQIDGTEELIELLGKIEESSLRAGNIIHALRRLVSNHKLKKRYFNINNSIHNIASLLESEAKFNEIAISLNLQDDLPEILGDSIHLEQVLLNLMRNAIEAMQDNETGLRKLTVESHQTKENEIEVAISDTGPGIPAEDVNRIFDAFVSTKPGGMGMGLSISRTIMETHGGRLSATSNSDGGATLRLTLPAPAADGE